MLAGRAFAVTKVTDVDQLVLGISAGIVALSLVTSRAGEAPPHGPPYGQWTVRSRRVAFG